MANTYTLIASNTLSTSAASVTFSAIPATYTDLVLRCSIRDNSASSFVANTFRLNNNSSAIYSYTNLTGNGTTANSGRGSGLTELYSLTGTTPAATANTFGNAELYIPNYTGTAKKVSSAYGVSENNATLSSIAAYAGLIDLTSAITSIQVIALPTYSFVSGSSFFLYGIKNS